ncbi:MAG: mandelate racemase/muconate lactonizing enzyme family protein [Pseudomonadota bacterium]
MAVIERLTLRRLRLPLTKPYRLSYRTFDEFEPYVVEAAASGGATAFGDGHISPGSSSETREGGWAFLSERLPQAIGRETGEAKDLFLRDFEQSKVAATAAVSALEALERNPLLEIKEETVLPLLTPIGAQDQAGVEAEVEEALSLGFRTFKIKVGKDVDADLERLGWIQRTTAGRASFRVDANRAYDRDAAIRFATSLEPDGVELFEQPCDADDWDANAAVAAVSRVPLMLDEPICTLADIERAAGIKGVGFCKVKLKRFGGLDRLAAGIAHIQAHGMGAVLGDGLGSEIQSWLEACVAAPSIRNAGEFNGFLKPVERLFSNPLPFENGAVRLRAGYWPELDRGKLEAATLEKRDFA